MLVLISHDRELAPNLLNSLQFVTLTAQTLNAPQLEDSFQRVLMQRITQILLEIWQTRNKLNECEYIDEFNKFLNNDAMALFCLKAILNRQ